jgi:V/A-type H+/Na+-transporting ATPase subunit F
MSRLIVMPDGDTAVGFELTGVDVIRTSDAGTARDRLHELLNDPNVGMIAVSQSILDQFDDATRRRIDTQIKPVVVGLPTGGPASAAADRRAYLSALLRRAVGFDLEFGGERGT